MFFDLINAPATFSGYINQILAEKLQIYVMMYLDKIFIYIKSARKAHMEAVP